MLFRPRAWPSGPPLARPLAPALLRHRAQAHRQRALAGFRHMQQGLRAHNLRFERHHLWGGQVFAGFFAVVLVFLAALLLALSLLAMSDVYHETPPFQMTGAEERFRLAGLHMLVLAVLYGLITWWFFPRWPLAAVLLTLLLSGLVYWRIMLGADDNFAPGPLNITLLTVPFGLLAVFVLYRRRLPWAHLLPVFGVAWGLVLALRVGAPLLPDLTPALEPLDATDLLAAILGLVLLLTHWQRLRPLFRWRATHAAAVGGVMGVGLLYVAAVQGLLWGISAWVGVDIQHHMSHNIRSGADLVLGLCVWAALPALVEEIAYRGYLQAQLTRALRPQAAWLVTAVVFAASHHSFISLLWLVPFGLYLGYLRTRYRSLWLPMLAHGWYNALVLLVDLFTA